MSSDFFSVAQHLHMDWLALAGFTFHSPPAGVHSIRKKYGEYDKIVKIRRRKFFSNSGKPFPCAIKRLREWDRRRQGKHPVEPRGVRDVIGKPGIFAQNLDVRRWADQSGDSASGLPNGDRGPAADVVDAARLSSNQERPQPNRQIRCIEVRADR